MYKIDRLKAKLYGRGTFVRNSVFILIALILISAHLDEYQATLCL